MLKYCREPSSAYYSYILYYSTCRLTQNVINIQRNKYNFFRLLIHLLRQQCVSSFINTFEPKSTINYFSSILTNIFKENKYLFWQHVLIPVHTVQYIKEPALHIAHYSYSLIYLYSCSFI